MEKAIYNLVRNSLDYFSTPSFVKGVVEEISNEEIIQLARKEIKAIQFFIEIELPGWSYWKDKEQILFELILNLSKET